MGNTNLMHRGKSSWWHGTWTSLCGITTPLSNTTWVLSPFRSVDCPACLRVTTTK
jgi:hypothetical protein